MDYRVAKTSDGRVLILGSNFVASLIDARWSFENRFSNSDKLDEVTDQEAEYFILRALQAKKSRSAREFYRAMYAGAEPDPEDFGIQTDGNDSEDDLPPDSSRVPKRPSPDGGTSAAQAVVEQVEIDVDK